ncbi:hypothetical protein J2T13_002561 [Paenibacillus sp. DS2015]|uniref:stalk domain-containing protein n=1 Tax=Paenibacillus sp. DS2015 TaxID=3373917 RepID=UPI003D20536C
MKLLIRIGKLMMVTLVTGMCTFVSGEGIFADSTIEPVSVAGGNGHGVAAWSDGTVTGWGYNKHGQVGDGTSIDQYIPKVIAGLSDIVKVAAARDTSFALSKEGEVWAWGDNYSRYVYGDVILPYQKRELPKKMEGLKKVTSLDTNGFAGVAVHSDGTATLWYPTYDPVEPMTLGVKYVPLKGIANASSAVILDYTVLIQDRSGVVSSLSIYNTFYGRYRSESEIPVVQPVTSSISEIAASGRDAFLLRKKGTIVRWNEESKKVAAVSGLAGISNLQTGYKRLYALKSNGTIWQWNYNTGQVVKPFQVKDLTGITDLWGSTGQVAFALRKDGRLMAWGDGYYAGMASGSGTLTTDKTLKTVYVQPSLSWTINNQSVSYFGTSSIVDGKLYVPFTSVFKALAIQVTRGEIESDTQHKGRTFSVWTFAYGGTTLVINASNPTELFVNGKRSDQIVNIPSMSNTTMFPLEMICETLGIELQWNKTTGEVVFGGA